MNTEGAATNKKTVALIIIPLVGLLIALYLLQTRQFFRPKASQEVYNAFEIRQEDGSRADCSGNECTVNSLKVNIKVDVAELERLGAE